MNTNLKTQILTLQQRYQGFSNFLVFALHMHTKREAKHRTHCVRVDFEFGFELGKVVDLNEFHVIPLQSARESVERNEHFSPAAKQQLLEMYLNVESSPQLLASQRMYPKNVLLPVLYVNKASGIVFITPNLSEYDPRTITRKLSSKVSDVKAKTSFEQMRQRCALLPGVQNTPHLYQK